MLLKYGSPEEAGMHSAKVARMENKAAQFVKDGITNSLVIFGARNGTIFIHKAFGNITHESDSPSLPVDTIFPMASISKAITSTCIMMLVEDGEIDLGYPVCDYFPEFTGEGKKDVKIHNLLTHTSGLRDSDIYANIEKKKGTVEIPPAAPNQYYDIHERLYLGCDTPLWKAPNQEMSYCNWGVELLAELLRRIAGKNISEFARERIFEPLGMKDTFYVVPQSVSHRVVKRKPDEESKIDWFSCPQALERPSGAGGVYSTAMDIAIFAQMFLNKGTYGDVCLLSPLTIEEMTRNQVPGIRAKYGDELFNEAYWGYGWSIKGTKRDTCGSIRTPASFDLVGAGGVSLMVDPVYKVISIYFSAMVKPFYHRLYNNMIMAAVRQDA